MSRCEIQKINDQFVVSGAIDEMFDQCVAALPLTGNVDINLKNLKSINSNGIRKWVELMQKMKSATIRFYECPKVFIDQVNIVQDFTPKNAEIMSFYVPYYNDLNDSEKSVLITRGVHYENGEIKTLPKVNDDKGSPMELDVIESKYFKFLKG